jgi:hypothetical protein
MVYRRQGNTMMTRRLGSMDSGTLLVLAAAWFFIYAAWLTSIVFCSVNSLRPLLVAAALFFPVGVVHGIGVWFGGW